MQNKTLGGEKNRPQRKNESEINAGTDKLSHVSYKTVNSKNAVVQDKFTEKRNASSTSSFSSNPSNQRRVTSRDLTEGNAAFIKRNKSDMEGNPVIRTNSKVQANSTTNTGKISDHLISDGKKNVSGVNTLILKKSPDQSVKGHSMRTHRSSSMAGGISKEMGSDIEEKKINFKGCGRSTVYLKKDSRDQVVCATNTQSKKSSSVRNTNIVRDHTELKKNIAELKAHKKELKMYEKKTNEKGKVFGSATRPVRNINSQQPAIPNEAPKVISETKKKSRDGHIASAKVPSTTSSSITSSVDSIMSRKINGKGRERTRTWTISSTSGDNDRGDLLQQVEGDSNDKNSKVYSGMESDLLKNGANGYLDSDRKGNAQVSEIPVKNVRKDTTKSIRDSQMTKEINKVNNEILDGKIKNELARYNENITVVENIESLEEEYAYEDDFEDYESDFEECSEEEDGASSNSHSGDSYNSDCGNESTKQFDEGKIMAEENWRKENRISSDSGGKDIYEDGEKKMDSGLYDSGGRRRQEGDVALMKIPRVDADEGFDEREESLRHSGKNLAMELDCPSRGCINCEVHICKRKPLTKEEIKKVCRRGKQLLKMITLDESFYSLFELPPIPYEAFMRSRGHLDTKQVSVQTNEESLCESVQTNSIIKSDAWTQKPPVPVVLGSLGTFGEDTLSCTLDAASWNHLRRFVELAGEVMMIMLEEQWNDFKALRKEGLPNAVFSRFSVELGHNGSTSMFWKSLFTSRPVCSIRFCETQTNLLVCAHGSLTRELETYKKNTSEDKGDANNMETISESSLLSLWSVNEPSHPLSLLSCQGNVSTTSFGGYFNQCEQLVFAGTDVGTICLWDLHMKGSSCKTILVNGSHRETVACPTFFTSGETHLGRIVGLEAVVDSKCFSEDTLSQLEKTNQVCSLDEWGTVVIWSVITMGGILLRSVGLVASMQLCLASILGKQTVEPQSKTLMEVAKQRLFSESMEGNALWNSLAIDNNCILAASDSGDVVCLSLDGDNRSIQVYPASKDSFASAECLAANPQGLPFFLVGNSMGQVCLYSHGSTRHFASWEVTSTLMVPCAVASISWSPQRPFVFFTVDILSRMTIWDLSSSDIFPFATVSPPQDGKITALSLSFCKENAPAYMAIGMDSGQVILHQLNEDLNCKNEETRGKELSQFLKYANHL